MLWMIRLLAVANLALALPKALLHPARDHGGLSARQASPSNTPTPNVVTHWSTKVVRSTYTIAPTSTPIPTSAVASTARPSIPPPANSAVQYITVTVTDPVYQTITAVAGQAVETIYETVTTRVAAETYHVVVMYITSIKTVVLPTATRSIFGTGVSSVLTPAKRLARRSYDYGGTHTLDSFTTVPPITQPSSIVTSTSYPTTVGDIVPVPSPTYDHDTHISTLTTAPPTTRHYSTTVNTATTPVITTVYTTVRPTIVQTVRQENLSTISSIVTITVTETTGTTTVRSTSPIAVTLTDYAVVGIYPTRGYPVTSIVSTPMNKLRYF